MKHLIGVSVEQIIDEQFVIYVIYIVNRTANSSMYTERSRQIEFSFEFCFYQITEDGL
jgi:hypothetical protein